MSSPQGQAPPHNLGAGGPQRPTGMPVFIPRPKARVDYVASTYGGLTSALMIPVTITVMVVVWGIHELTPIYAGRNQQAVFVVVDERKQESSAAKFGGSLINALIIVAGVTVITFLMVLLYKFRCIKIIIAWFVFTAGMVLFFMMFVWLDLVATKFQISYDFISVAWVLWNFGVVGIVSLFYYGHPKFMQGYLIVVSVIIAWMFSRLPEWTTWAILVAVALYDILAVLCPGGPLALLVKEAQARNEQIPGFVYDSGGTAVLATNTQQEVAAEQENLQGDSSASPPEPNREKASANNSPRENEQQSNRSSQQPNSSVTLPQAGAAAASATDPPAQQPSRRRRKPAVDSDSEDEGEPDPFESAQHAHPFKLGLGDFIFYSILVGRASMYCTSSWIIAYLFIGIGLIGTLSSLLFLRGKVPALPALPISIFGGVASYFLCRYTVIPLCYWAAANSVIL